MSGMKAFIVKARRWVRLDRAIRLVWQAGPKWVVASGAVTVLQGFLPLAALYLMKLIVDAVSEAVGTADPAMAFKRLLFLVILAGCVALIQASLQAVSGIIQEGLSLTVGDRMYDMLHAKSVEVDLDYYENPRYFDTLHRAQREGAFRPAQIVNTLIGLGQSSVSLIAVSGLLLSFHWAVSLLLIAAAAPGIFVRIKFSRIMFDWQTAKTPDERKAMYFNWILTGNVHAKEMRLFGIGEEISRRFSEVRRLLRSEKLAISRKRAMAEFLVRVFGSLIVFAMLGAVVYRAVLGAITLGDMVMFYQAFQRCLGSLKSLLGALADLHENNLFISYLYEFLDLKPRVEEPLAPLPLPREAVRGLRIEHVWFRYPGTAHMVLKDISFHVRPGEVVALVGKNGSGKTTLAKLICRLYDPAGGRIALENIPLHQLSKASLRCAISAVFQDFAKYELTVEDNIRFGNVDLPATDMESVENAAMASGADRFIAKLPREYRTVLGKLFQGGVELSIGQWQMIAIARALLRDARLIVLDEPASSLDPNAEFRIFSRFKNMLEKKSALLISHRLSTVRMADRILVLKDGRIIEQGAHEELMGRSGYYADLFRYQAKIDREQAKCA